MVCYIVPYTTGVEAVAAALFVSGITLIVLCVVTFVQGVFPFDRAARCTVYLLLGAVYAGISVVTALIKWFTGTVSPVLIFAAVAVSCAASAVISAVLVTWALSSNSAEKNPPSDARR